MVPNRLGFALSATLLGFALAPGRVDSQPQADFAVGVVRHDGILIPFARFDGATWDRIWVEPGRKLAVPASLDAVPAAWFPPDGHVPDKWHLWLPDDARATSPFEMRQARPITVQQPVRFEAACLTGAGLQTDYRDPEDRQQPASAHPRLNAGLALTVPTVRVDLTVELEPASPLARWATEHATLPFHRAEDRHLENYDKSERLPLDPIATRRSTPVQWTKVLRLGTAQASDRTYYLEGEVKYAPKSVMVGYVWLQVSGDREASDAEVVLTDEDRALALNRVLLGVVRVGDRRFWIFEKHQSDSESFEVVDASDLGKTPVSVLEIAAGGC
jgi:hypothetical protein